MTFTYTRSLCAVALVLLLFAVQQNPAQAAGRVGPWCTGVLEVLGGHDLPPMVMAEQILALQSPPALSEAPRRLVHVSSAAPRGGNGTSEAPYTEVQAAVRDAQPGDKIIIQPGTYRPVVLTRSGTAGDPIILAAQTDATGQAVIDGTGADVRGLIEVRGASHIIVSGFRLQNAPRDGIFVEGSDTGERDIKILDNDIDTTGNSAVYVAGIVMRFITKVDEYRLFDVLIQGNRVTNTNTPKGVNEAISLGGGVDGFVIRNNHIFDTRQYGIDAKAGAINGTITDNVIHGIERHGIYLDAGSRTVANIDVQRNAIFGARNGIVFAREADRDPQHTNLHSVTVFDNLVFDIEKFGVMAYRHPHDSGIGRFGDITVSGNCLCNIGGDAVRLGGIGEFTTNFRVEDNLIVSSGGDVWNKIGAETRGNGSLLNGVRCPG